jgi:plasmid maintenance system antidote protein VapI
MIILLEKGLDIPADHWLRLQRQYEWQSRKRESPHPRVAPEYDDPFLKTITGGVL